MTVHYDNNGNPVLPEDHPPEDADDYFAALADATPVRDEPAPALAGILDQIVNHMEDHLVMPDEHGHPTLALWAAHTWATSAFYTTPRLVLDSPEPGCGKSRVLELLALYANRAKQVANTSTAAVFRLIGAAYESGNEPPTFLMDETDTVFGPRPTPSSEELRGIINAGYKRGATVDRCEGDAASMKTVEFPIFAPMALAGLHANMPDTITTRSVVIHMRKRAPHEQVKPYRLKAAEVRADPVREWLGEAINAMREDLEVAEPALPDGVEDRAAEVWEPLLAVADAAGGHWPKTARAACLAFVHSAEAADDVSQGVRLLRDCREVIGYRDRIATEELVKGLNSMRDAGWNDFRRTGLTVGSLYALLRPYQVIKKKVRTGDRTVNGFIVAEGFADAWHRYVDPIESAGGIYV